MGIKERLNAVEDRIEAAALACNRDPGEIRLVSVSKTVSSDRVEKAAQAGARLFGENYIQEAREKIQALASLSLSWHFIGRLQTNKAKYAVRLFDLIHTVDSVKLAVELDKQAKKIDKTQPILIQVNLGREPTKSGVFEEDALELTHRISLLENLSIRGLMTMPPFFNDPKMSAPYFAALRNLKDRIERQNIPNVSVHELSMGMTGDFEEAIIHGATLIRIGTAVFGKRA